MPDASAVTGRYAAPPYFALDAATSVGAWIRVGTIDVATTISLKTHLQYRPAPGYYAAGEPIAQYARVEFDEQGNVYRAS